MTPTTVWFGILVPVLLSALLARALWAAVATETCARWLLAASRAEPIPLASDRDPWLVVLLPMLREQTAAPSTIAAFAALTYPSHRAVVAVITTDREEVDRHRHRTRLPDLAARDTLFAGDLHGLFPVGRCDHVAAAVNTSPPSRRFGLLAALFDAEPTTAQVVETVASRLPDNCLPVVHLHQPAAGGRKAGQLNYVVNRLEQILGPSGWHPQQDADNTYFLIYDADALPDNRTLTAFARAAIRHQDRTGHAPEVIQQQRLPLLGRRPIPAGATGLLLAEEWVYQLRRSLGIELARIRLHQHLAGARLPGIVRTLLRPMIYGVGCGMAVQLAALRTIGGFPEPMEDLGTGHRLSLLGATSTPSTVAVLDEPYIEPSGLTNLHALAFTASARPDLHARAVAAQPSRISRAARAALILREGADEAAWLIGAPLTAAAVTSSWQAGPAWTGVAVLGIVLHGPLLTARLLHLAPALHAAVQPPAGSGRPPQAAAGHRATLIAASPLQPFIRLIGPWRLIGRRLIGRATEFGKTER